MDSGFKKDLRGGVISMFVALTLFVVFLFQLGSKGAQHGYNLIGHLEALRQPAARAEVDPPPHVNAREIPVFCYHFVRNSATPLEFVRILGGLFFNLPLLNDMDVWTQSVREFEREMKCLSDRGYTTVDLTEFAAWRRGDITLPEKSVVITFDDGDRSVIDVAYPILQRYGFKATLFIATSRVGQQWEGVDGMTWEELAFLQRSGVFTIESHSHGLHYKKGTPEGPFTAAAALQKGFITPPNGEPWRNVVFNDLRASRRLIAEKVGNDARHLAWPYGETSTTLDSIAVEAGFQTMSTLQRGMNDPVPPDRPSSAAREIYKRHAPREDILVTGVPAFVPHLADSRFVREPHSIRRYTITARTSIRDFKMMLDGWRDQSLP